MVSTAPAPGSSSTTGADATRRVVIGLEVLLAVAAFGGSWALVSNTVDASSYVSEIPFSSTVFGGLALAVVVAIPATVAAAAGLTHRTWSRPAHLTAGALLMVWIVVEVIYIGLTSWLQPVMFAWGAAIVLLGSRVPKGPVGRPD